MRVDRTAISKISTRTNILDTYAKIKEKIKEISQESFYNLSLEQIMQKLTKLKINDRVIRVSSPLNSKKFHDTVPSPMAKSYEQTLVVKFPEIPTNNSIASQKGPSLMSPTTT